MRLGVFMPSVQMPAFCLQVTAPKELTETVYTDTVAVLPGYARAVAADLRGSSERWRQYQEPPSYFDDALGGLTYQLSPAAQEAYQDASVLGRALKVAPRALSHDPLQRGR